MAGYKWNPIYASPFDLGINLIVGGLKYIPTKGYFFISFGSNVDRVADQIIASCDETGTIWTPYDVTTISADPAGSISDIAWSPSLGIYVVTTTNEGDFGSGGSTIWSSPDGSVWTSQGNPTAGTATQPAASTVVWIEDLGIFVAGNGGALDLSSVNYAVATSPDGATWTGISTPWDTTIGTNATTVDGLCYSDTLGLIVATGKSPGDANHLMTSPDGVTWTNQTTPIDGMSGTIVSPIWVERLSRFLAINALSTSNQLYSSTDGVTWTQSGLGFVKPASLCDTGKGFVMSSISAGSFDYNAISISDALDDVSGDYQYYAPQNPQDRALSAGRGVAFIAGNNLMNTILPIIRGSFIPELSFSNEFRAA